MTTRYDIITPRPGKDGKTFWLKIGAMFPAKEGNGYTISLDALPLPDKDGKIWLKASEPKPRETTEPF